MLTRCKTVRSFGLQWMACALFFFGLAAGGTTPVQAADSTEISRGLAWLQAQVQPDGAVAGESASIATPSQVSAEALLTLAQLATGPSPLAQRVATSSESTTEAQARSAIALVRAGQAPTGFIAALRARQNVDGGFGDNLGSPSNTLDTAWTLLAFRMAGFNDAPSLQSGINYLIATARTDGGFATPGSDSSVYATSYALQALIAYRDAYALSPYISKSTSWLNTARGGSFSYGETLYDALATISLAGATTDSTQYANLLAALKAAQAEDGSWYQDPYLTSIVLRALAGKAQPPPSATQGRVTGQIVDGSSRAPLGAASISIAGLSVSSDENGNFETAGINPGSYPLTVNKAGYASAQVQVTVSTGAVTNAGAIALAVMPDSALIRGVVVDGGSGQPLAGASILVSVGSTQLSVVSASNGAFELGGIPTGAGSIAVQKTGYRSLSTTLQFAGSTSYNFSPTLYAEGEPAPTTATLGGRIIASDTGTAIAGAQISVGAKSTTSAADGSFTLGQLDPGATQFTVQANGYGSATFSGVLSAGLNRVGDLRLQPSTTQGRVRGQVVDASTMAPLSDALISVGGISVRSALDGRFETAGINPGSHGMTVAKTGYVSAQAQLTVTAGAITNAGSIALAVMSDQALVRGVVVDGGNGQPLAGAGITISAGSATLSATSAANGAFELGGIPAVNGSIAITKTGYRSVSATVQFAAGTSYNFSPTLYAEDEPAPTQATITGRIIANATGSAIAGAQISVSGKSAVAAADGSFSIEQVEPGAVTIAVQASSYDTASFSGLLSAGVNRVGDLRLQLTATTLTLFGEVINEAGGAPVPGALVRVQGTDYQAVSNSRGSYRIQGLPETHLNLIVEANGYYARTFAINASEFGNLEADLPLTAAKDKGISLSASSNLPSYEPFSDVQIAVTASNELAQDRLLIFTARIYDQERQLIETIRFREQLLGVNPAETAYRIPANGSLDLGTKWYNQNVPTGDYSIVVSAAEISGEIVAETTVGASVDPMMAIGGGITVDPPITQAGTTEPVTISALVSNRGNLDYPGGQARFSIVLDTPDTSASGTGAAKLSPVLQGSPLDEPRGSAVDAAGNIYTANSTTRELFRISPDGGAQPLTTLPVAPSDLVLLSDGSLRVLTAGGRIYTVNQSGLLPGFTATNVLNGAIAADSGDNLFVAGMTNTAKQILIRIDADGQRTELLQEGFSGGMGLAKGADGKLYVSSHNDKSMVRVDASGRIESFTKFLSRPTGLLKEPAGSFLVADQNRIVRIGTNGGFPSVVASGLSPQALAYGPSGEVLVTDAGSGSVVRLSASGQVSPFGQSFGTGPAALAYDAAGQLYVSGSDGSLRRRNSAGTIETLLTSGKLGASVTDLAIGSDGTVYAVDGAGGARRYQPGSAVTTPLAGVLGKVGGLAVDGANRLMIAETTTNRIARYNSSGSTETLAQPLLSSPVAVAAAPDGTRYILNASNLTHIPVGARAGVLVAQIGGAGNDIALKPGGGVYLLVDHTKLMAVTPTGVVTLHANVPASRKLAVAADGSVYLADQLSNKIHLLRPDKNLETFAATPAVINDIEIDANGLLVAGLDDGFLYRFAGDRTPVKGVETGRQIALSMDASGSAYVLTVDGQFLRVDATGQKTRLADRINDGRHFARHGDGAFDIMEGSSALLKQYDPSGALLRTIAGYGVPTDLEWMDGEIVFTDSGYGRVYRLSTVDGVARLFAGIRLSQLRYAGGVLYGIVPAAGRVVRIAADGSVSDDHVNASLTSLSGIALHGDEMALANPADNRLFVLASNRSVKAAYIGLSAPAGIAVDATGQVYVANSTGIVRYSADGLEGELLPLSEARAVAIAPDGTLWASSGRSLLRYVSDRFVTVATGTNPITALAFDSDQLYAADAVTLRKLTGDRLVLFAGGIQRVRALRFGADQALYIGSDAGGMITRYDFSDLKIVTDGVPALRALVVRSDDLYVAGSREIYSVDSATGALRDQSVGPLLGPNAVLYSLTADAQDRIFAVAGGQDTGSSGQDAVYRVEPARPPVLPPPGMEVYRGAATLAPMAVGGAPQTVALGQWVPPYAGDYSFHLVADDGVATGELISNLHIGSHATGTVASNRSMVSPGDAALQVSVAVSGAIATSFSKVDTDNVRLLSAKSGAISLSAMGADPAGNIYLVRQVAGDLFGIERVSPDGTTETIFNFRHLLFGSALPVDRQSNLYVPNYQQLLRVRSDGTSEVVATMPSNIRGMTIDSQDNLIVLLWNGDLYKVTQDGSVTKSGFRPPANTSQITIDGVDNLYFFHGGTVTRLDPSGRASTVLDGVAGFENEGLPIAGDCADNLLITPWFWPGIQESPMGGPAEEHTLLQVSATGQVSKVFDGFSVFPLITDLDFIVYDRFSHSLLMWGEHLRTWRLPITCGAINTDLHVITPAGQAVSGLSIAPSAEATNSDGSRELVWNLKDVTAQGRSVQFDTVLAGMKLGDERSVASEVFLLFRNSFTGGSIKLPLKVPKVNTGGMVAMNVATDRASYPAHTPVVIDLTLDNPNDFAVEGRLRLDLIDANGAFVKTLLDEDQSVPASDQLVLHPPLDTGTYYAGGYSLKASFTDDSGYLQANASAQFSITASGGDPSSEAAVKVTPTTDKPVYGEFDAVQILGRTRSNAANYIYEDLTLVLTVVDPNGAQVFSETRPIRQLMPGAMVDMRSTYKLPGGLTGIFGVHAAILDRTGSVIAAGTTSFEARADDAAKLTGSVVAVRKVVPVTESQTCRDTIVNGGSRTLVDLPVRQSIVELDADRLVSTTTRAYTLAANAQETLTRAFSTDGYKLGTHACVLEAQVNGKWKTLGYDTFTVDPPPIRVDASVELGKKGRLLVLMDGAPVTGSSKAEPAPEQQRSFLEKLLTREGWSYTIVTDPEAFTWELRSGEYNVYALFSESAKLPERMQMELREAVYRGEGLLEAGAHDQRHQNFDDALGIKYQGKSAGVTGIEVIATEPGPAGYADIVLRDKPLSAQLGAAGSLGRYVGGKTSDPSALATRNYGRAKSVYLGYDLLAEATLAGDNSLHAKLLIQSLGYIQPVYANTLAGRVVPISIKLQNEGNATPGQLVLPMPSGATIVDRGTATVRDGALVWDYNLAVDASQTYIAWVRLPEAGGRVTFTAQVLTGPASDLEPHTTATFSLQLIAAAGLADARPLAASAAEFKQVALWLDKADTALKNNDAQTALAHLAKASDELLKVTHASAAELRLMIDQALLDAGRRYWGG